MRLKIVGYLLLISLTGWIFIPYALSAKGNSLSPKIAASTNTENPRQLKDAELLNIIGGKMTETQCKAWKWICVGASIGSFFGVVGALIFGPTALVCTADLAFDLTGC